MSKDRSFFGTLAIIGIGAAAAIGTIAAYQHRKEIREKANEWAAITISRIKDAAEEVGITNAPWIPTVTVSTMRFSSMLTATGPQIMLRSILTATAKPTSSSPILTATV